MQLHVIVRDNVMAALPTARVSRQRSRMIVAITGANGFIGRHLVRRFGDAGCEVRGIVRRDFATGDLGRQLAGVDVMVHAAGATRAPTHAGLEQSNVELTSLTLREAQRAGVGRFVFLSSQAAAGPARALETPITESDVAAPIEEYGRSKRRAELVVQASGIEYVIVRPVATYGPADRDFLALFRLARYGIAIHPANREHWLSIVHVRDLVDAVLHCAQASGAAGHTYFIGGETPVRWRDLFDAAASAAGKHISLEADLPAGLVRFGGRVGDVIARKTGRASLLTTEKITLSRARYWVCSSARARRELGFETRIDLQDGMRDAYHWYRASGWL